jgi:hypothetical protein
MRSTDFERMSKITAAINEAVPNLETTMVETEEEITLTTKLPKAGVVGRPRKQTIQDTNGGQV